MPTTRFPNGVTNTTENDSMGSLIIPTPQNPFLLFDDFTFFNDTLWATTVNLTAAPISTTAAAVGGAISLTTTAATDQFTFETNNQVFAFVQGKQTWFELNVFTTNIVNLTDASFQFGIGNTGQTDTVEFFYDESANTLSIQAVESSGSTSEVKVIISNLTSLFPTINTPQVFSFHYDGVETITFYIDNAAVGTLSNTSIPFGVPLIFKSSMQGASAAVRIYDIDYALGAQER